MRGQQDREPVRMFSLPLSSLGHVFRFFAQMVSFAIEKDLQEGSCVEIQPRRDFVSRSTQRGGAASPLLNTVTVAQRTAVPGCP